MNDFIHEGGNYVLLDDARIYMEETGTPDGVPVVFLHGGLGSICDYSPFVGKMDKRFRCIGMDTRGHGMSTLGQSTLSYALLENDVLCVLEQLKISQCAVVGFSDGGIIGMRLAASNPARITKLITIGADWNPPSPELQALFSGLTPESWQKKFPETVTRYKTLNPEADFEKLMQQVTSMWLDMPPSGYPGKRTQSMQCPSLIIRGDSDPFVPLAHCARIHEEVPHSHFFNVPFSGHAAHIEQPEIVSMLINRFLC